MINIVNGEWLIKIFTIHHSPFTIHQLSYLTRIKLLHEKNPQKIIVRVKKALHILGPGLITGASDDDPSGIATYSQAGAGFGFCDIVDCIDNFSDDGIHPGNVCAHRNGNAGRINRNIKKKIIQKVFYIS